MTIAEKIIIIIACAVLLLAILWVIGVRNLLKKLRNKTRLMYNELCVELDRLYEFTDRVADKLSVCGVEVERIVSIKSEAQGLNDIEAKAECDAILQSRLKTALEKNDSSDINELKKEYIDIEIDIANVRKKYNAAVREYNCQRKIFPDRIVSAIFRYKPFGFYTADQVDAE